MPSSRIDLMIVDDDYAFLRSLAVELRRCGFHCHCFEDADSAIAALSEVCPDVALIDLDLSGLSGLTLAEKMACRQDCCPPVIMMSGNSDGLRKIDGMHHFKPIYATLDKPIRSDHLVKMIEAAVCHRRHRLKRGRRPARADQRRLRQGSCQTGDVVE